MNPIRQLENYVSNKLSMSKTAIAIMKLEAQLAGLSLFPFLLSLSLLFIVLIGLWLTVMFLTGYFFAWISGMIFLGIFSVFILNFVFGILLFFILIFNLKNMSFKKTRELLLSREDES